MNSKMKTMYRSIDNNINEQMKNKAKKPISDLIFLR